MGEIKYIKYIKLKWKTKFALSVWNPELYNLLLISLDFEFKASWDIQHWPNSVHIEKEIKS